MAKDLICDISALKTLEDRILVKDLALPKGIEVFGHHPEDIVAHIALPREEKEVKAPEQPVEGAEASAEPDKNVEEKKKEE